MRACMEIIFFFLFLLSEHSDLIEKHILVLSLHHASTILPQSGDNFQDIHLSLLLQLLHPYLSPYEHAGTTNTSTGKMQ